MISILDHTEVLRFAEKKSGKVYVPRLDSLVRSQLQQLNRLLLRPDGTAANEGAILDPVRTHRRIERLFIECTWPDLNTEDHKRRC